MGALWNVKTSILHGLTDGETFAFGDEVPDSEIDGEDRKKRMLNCGWLLEPAQAKAQAKAKATAAKAARATSKRSK